jgi:hypothetical protein
MGFDKWVICNILLILPVMSYAECGSNFCENVKIQEMQVTYDGIVWIQTTGTETNLQNCVPQGGSITPFIKVDANTSGGKNLYSALLSAQARDKSFLVRTRDGVSPCEIHYISVN